MRLSEALQAILANPDDLSTLPQLVARAVEMEGAETTHLERIGRLQELNKSYLAQIPIPGTEQKEEQPEAKDPTLADATAYLVESLGGNK